ncbi:MAG TPA: glycosyltransferase family 2 protein [Gemmatimonadaceae bacterium]
MASADTRPLPELCIVVPAFNEQENLPVLYRELAQALDARGVSFQLLVVDDGSRDRTPEILRQLARQDARVIGLRLSRNFGHQEAISIGLQHAKGRSVAIMDADLQDRPSDLLALYECWRGGADVAYAVRRTRREWLGRRLAYLAFYRALARLADVQIPLDSGDFCVMDGAFVERLNALPERLRFVRGLRAWLGGRQEAVAVDRDARRFGEPQYTFSKLLRLALDGLFSFSDAPLRLASLVGASISMLAFAGAVVILVWKFMGELPSGAATATIALGVFFLGGLQLLTIGILGEYISRIFREVKSRPVAVVAEMISGAATPSSLPQHVDSEHLRPVRQ